MKRKITITSKPSSNINILYITLLYMFRHEKSPLSHLCPSYWTAWEVKRGLSSSAGILIIKKKKNIQEEITSDCFVFLVQSAKLHIYNI